MEAAHRALERMKPVGVALPPPKVVKAALDRPAPAPVFPVVKAVTPVAKAAAAVVAPPPAPLPMPPSRNGPIVFPPGEKFVAVMEQELADERQAAREAAKLEPLTIVISDQQELRVLYELAARLKSKPVPMLRRHIRGWGRTELDAKRAEQTGEPIPSN